MSGWFEIRATDAAGRLGELEVPRRDLTVETPALMPVVNPNVETIAPTRLAEDFDVDLLITNSYIIYQTEELREQARTEGLHELLEFPGAIMTDSGSFQLAEYGEIEVTTEEILTFQREIGSDIGTPVDVPTPPDVDREQASDELQTTQERLETAEEIDTGDMLVSAPIQGSTYPELREQAAHHAYGTSLDVFPIGAVVPLMRSYRYADVVDLVAAAKRELGTDAPVHLFGAGHPMLFALAAALGCDLFDSAAYALYARDDRYLTVRDTKHLEDLEQFPCSCPVCTEFDPASVRSLDGENRETKLAEHNLHVSLAELRRVRQAIRSGSLLELVDARARSHPAMLDGYRTLLDHVDLLEANDPVSKDTFFYLSSESANRPEVQRHQDRLARLDPEGAVLITEAGEYGDYDEYWHLVPPFGPVPKALSRTYPLTAELPERTDRRARERATEGIRRLVEGHPETTIDVAHRGWSESVLEQLPAAVDTHDLTDTSS
jgi:7-cyano-7-deazaguanine tRNA-ribosyltransferase